MKKLIKHGHEYYGSLSHPDPRVSHGVIINSRRAWPVKMDEHQHDEHEDIEEKVGIFHILNGILAKTRNPISPERFLGRIVVS